MPTPEIRAIKAIYDTIQQIIFVLNVEPPGSNNFRFLLLNKTYENTVGLRHIDISGKTPLECLGAETSAAVSARYWHCVQFGEYQYLEHLKLAGRWGWWETTLSPQYNDAGLVHQIVGTSIVVPNVEAMLRTAIAEQKLQVHYQPICRLSPECSENPISPGCIAGYEALIRWPESGYHPGQFLPAAKRAGLIQPLTDFVIDEVAKKLTQIDSQLWVAVNVSEFSFKASLETAIARHGIDRVRLGIEITEDAELTSEAEEVITSLRIAGTQFKIDDYGTKGAGLEWVVRIKPDALKIDRWFVNGVTENPNQQLVCETTIELAQGFDPPITVIAEGIENPNDRDWLMQRGVELGQGWLFGAAALL
ncbi:MAG: EAL domain-containing protein [Cyanobacteria bacterium J06638_22]